jgi:AAA+ superfamily predicted ATPase
VKIERVEEPGRVVAVGGGGGADGVPPIPNRLRRQQARKSRNNTDVKVAPFDLPLWFLERNVVLHNQSHEAGLKERVESLLQHADGPNGESDESQDLSGITKSFGPFQAIDSTGGANGLTGAYISAAQYIEAAGTISGCLSLSSEAQNTPSYQSSKTNVALYFPVDGATTFVTSIIETIAEDLKADLVKLDAQDISQLGEDYLLPNAPFSSRTIRSLSYDALARSYGPESRERDEDEDDMENEEEEMSDNNNFGTPIAIPIDLRNINFSNVKTFSRQWLKALSTQDQDSSSQGLSGSPRMRKFAEKVASAAETKKGQETSSEKSAIHQGNTEVQDSSLPTERRTIICISDFMQITNTILGSRIVAALSDVVQRRRKQGENIMIIGSSAATDLAIGSMEAAQSRLNNESSGSLFHTMLLTPMEQESGSTETPDKFWSLVSRQWALSVNTRHLERMTMRLDPSSSKSNALSSSLKINSTSVESAGLDQRILGYDEIHQLALLIIGLDKNENGLTKALEWYGKSLAERRSWNPRSIQASKPTSLENLASYASGASLGTHLPQQIKAEYDRYERKLLGGIITPQNIHTTFDQVHAPEETINAVRMLTSLSLQRPDAFRYGVLKLESIPGLLLYGPPGTGKTLMAKAVAKESGATVLSISGSEVNDMYVGESEKNVRAIFSLARKLSPCVVFIDEADSLLATRGERTRRSHRDTINQFLREWDGMNDMSVFLMVATNRPFDLDDAVLRRLPRRLLVDLPTERDREAILRIHLRDEELDTSVSFTELASLTPFYSGSDLKNVAVAAALACVRNENALAAAAREKGQSDYQHREVRLLRRDHFETALNEISASISEDMTSLTAIRKFDEQFGDRKGRRKKLSLGFEQREIKDGEVRVRV